MLRLGEGMTPEETQPQHVAAYSAHSVAEYGLEVWVGKIIDIYILLLFNYKTIGVGWGWGADAPTVYLYCMKFSFTNC
jgi:hypothetical protein